MKSKVSIVKCSSYNRKEVEWAVRKSVDLVGGISAFVKESDRVLLKPNLLSARPPETGVDTHPEVLRALIKLVKGARGIPLVGDSPGGYIETVEEVYEKSGIKRVTEEEGVELVNFSRWEKKVENIPIASYVTECDVFISIPKLKTHNLTILTGAVKNVFGVVPGLSKTECHRRAPHPEDFASFVVKVFSNAVPDLSVLDGVVGMEGDGPNNGVLRNIGLIMASSDSVALDAVLTNILGLEPFDILTTKEAHSRGLGIGNLEEIEVVGERLTDIKIKDFKFPQTSILSKIPRPILKGGTGLIKFRLTVLKDKCDGCGICVKSCPQQAINFKLNKAKIDSSKCVLCLCCSEVCPQGAVSIKKSLFVKFAKVMGV